MVSTPFSLIADLIRFSNLFLPRNLPNKGDEFLDMLNHPLLETFAPWFLGEGFQIYNMSANVALRGGSGIHMHKDQSSMPPDQIDFSYMLNAIWYLTDLTPEKGATLIYPGSHLKNVAPLGHMSDAVSVCQQILSLTTMSWSPLLIQLLTTN